MAKDMLGIAVRKLVTLPTTTLGIVYDLLEKLADPVWVNALKKFLRKENPWPEVQKTVSGLLELVATVTVPAMPAFDVATHFRVMTEEERETAEVSIGWMNYQARALVETWAEAEPEILETTLRIHELRRKSKNDQIVVELGEQATTTWAQMYEMMSRQDRGQGGKLLVNGWMNIFYIPDTKGMVWTVLCNRDPDCHAWHIYAYPLHYPNVWYAGNGVVSG